MWLFLFCNCRSGILFLAFFFLYAAAEVSYGNWIFTYTVKLNLSDATNAALLTSGFWGAFTVGRLIGVPLSTRFQPATILVIDLVGAIASVAVVLLFPQSIVALWLGSIGTGAHPARATHAPARISQRRVRNMGRRCESGI